MLTPIAYSQYIYIYIFIQNSEKFREFTLFLLPSQPVAIVCLIQRFGATRRLSFKFSGVCCRLLWFVTTQLQQSLDEFLFL